MVVQDLKETPLNLKKIALSLIGMTLIAGLAYYQGRVDQMADEEVTIFAGTALETQIEAAKGEDDTLVQAASESGDCLPETQAGLPAPSEPDDKPKKCSGD